MGLITKEVEVSITNNTQKYYKDLNYDIDSLKVKNKYYKYTMPKGTTIIVKIEDLPKGSNVYVTIECDYCGKIYEKQYYDYNKNLDNSYIKKCSCDKCKMIKTQDTMILLYGKSSPLQVDEIKERQQSTNVLKYGGKSPANSIITLNKMKITNFDKFGVFNAMQNPEISKKSRINANISLSKNHNVNTSNQQIYLHNLLGGELNFPVKQYIGDILINNNIMIEYDGGGHDLQVKLNKITEKEFLLNEIKKYYVYKNNGYVLFRIKSLKDFLPSDDKIIEIIKYGKEIINSGRSWIEFNIDESKVKCSKFEEYYDFGELRKIKLKDINISS